MRRLGVLVVGQSPRPEIEDEFARLLGDVQVELVGCLDGMDRHELTVAETSGDLLFTRLPDGGDVTLAKSVVVKGGERQISALEKAGVDAIVIMCTGQFPTWQGRRLFFAADLFKGVVRALCPQGHLAVLVPLASQMEGAKSRWRGAQIEVTPVLLSPNADMDTTDKVVDTLIDLDPDLLVLDCVSYTRATKSRLRARTGKPAVLAVSVVARAMAEWLE